MRNETPATHDENIQKIGKLISDIDIAMLTTINEEGKLFSRPMATQQVDFDGDLYFFTLDDSPKAQQILHDTRVNVAYSNPKKNDYVSISGKAEILHDRAKMQELWRPDYKAWFPQELDTPHICLLKIHSESAEYWDSPSSPVATTLALIQNTVTGKKGPIGDHAKVSL